MKLGYFTIHQRHNGDYEFCYAKHDNYPGKEIITEQELTTAILNLIDKKKELRSYCKKLYQELQFQPENNTTLPEYILSILHNCPEIPSCAITSFTDEQDLQYWIDGFNITYQTSFSVEDITSEL